MQHLLFSVLALLVHTAKARFYYPINNKFSSGFPLVSRPALIPLTYPAYGYRTLQAPSPVRRFVSTIPQRYENSPYRLSSGTFRSIKPRRIVNPQSRRFATQNSQTSTSFTGLPYPGAIRARSSRHVANSKPRNFPSKSLQNSAPFVSNPTSIGQLSANVLSTRNSFDSRDRMDMALPQTSEFLTPNSLSLDTPLSIIQNDPNALISNTDPGLKPAGAAAFEVFDTLPDSAKQGRPPLPVFTFEGRVTNNLNVATNGESKIGTIIGDLTVDSTGKDSLAAFTANNPSNGVQDGINSGSENTLTNLFAPSDGQINQLGKDSSIMLISPVGFHSSLSQNVLTADGSTGITAGTNGTPDSQSANTTQKRARRHAALLNKVLRHRSMLPVDSDFRP